MKQLRNISFRKQLILIVIVICIIATVVSGGASALLNLFTQRIGYHPYDQGINRAYWTGVAGTSVASLTGLSTYPNQPTGTDKLPKFQATDWNNPATTANWADSYGQRMYGYIVAPETGTYYFWISSDDASQLSLSTDSNPANKAQIAYVSGWTNPLEWTKEANQASVGISLTAGQYYFIEALQKEGGGGDNLGVGWRKPSDGAGTSPTEVIPGSSLSTRTPSSTVNAASGEKGLVGWWKLDGNAKDSSPYRNNGTVNGGTVVADRKNASSSAYSFNGTSDYIAVPNFDYGVMRANAMSASWTMSIWAKWSGTNGNERVLIGRQGCNGGIYTYNNQYAFAIKGAGCWTGAQTILASGITDTSTWHLLTATYQAGAMAFYADGALQGTATLSDMTSYGTLFGIGSTGSNAYQFSGSLDDARVYNRALSQSEITNLYNSYNSQINLNANPTNTQVSGNINTGLVGYWNLNGNAHDSTPYRDNGTFNNATLTTDHKGRANSAYAFVGTTPSVISLPTPGPYNTIGTSSFTVTAWVKTSEALGQRCIMSTGASSLGFRFGYGGGEPYYLVGDGANYQEGTIGTTMLNDGSWHHVSIVYSHAGNWTLTSYIDGVSTGSTTLPATITGAVNGPGGFIGSMGGGTNGAVTGSIDDVRFYNRALTASEVQAVYTSPN